MHLASLKRSKRTLGAGTKSSRKDPTMSYRRTDQPMLPSSYRLLSSVISNKRILVEKGAEEKDKKNLISIT